MKNKPNFNRNVIITSILAAAAPAAIAVDGLTLKTQADLNRRIQIEYNVRQAAAALITEFQTDVDGYPLPPQMEPVGIVAPGVSAIPASSSAPRTDSMGLELAYCAWNNGTNNTGLPNYLDGIPNNINASTVAVIHRGLDGMFQTTCADLGPAPGNLGVGDDVVVVQSASEVYKGIGGTFFYGDPVNTEAELSCAVDGGLIDCEALPERSMRFVNETGRMYQVLRDPVDNEKRFFDVSGGWGTGYGNPASLTDGYAYTQNRTVIGANSAPAGIRDQLYVQGNSVDPALSVAGNNKSLAFRAADGTRYGSAGLNALGDFEISSDLIGQDLVISLPPSGDPLNPSASMRMDETGTTFSAPVFIDDLFTNQVITEDLAVQGNTILGDNAAQDSLQVNAASEFRGPVTITAPNVLNAQGGIETPVINASGQVLDIRAATTRVSGDLEVLGQSTLNGLLTANGGVLTTTLNADDIASNTIYSMVGVFGNAPNLRAGTVLTANGDAAFEGRTSFYSPTGAFSEVNGSTFRQANATGTRLSQLNPESGLAFVDTSGGTPTNSRIFYDPARGLIFTNNTGLPYIFENGGLDVADNSTFRADLAVLGNTNLSGNLGVGGDTTLSGQLITNGQAIFNNTLTSNGVFEANNTSNFNGLVNFNQPIAVNNTSTFTGLATFNGGIQTTFINTSGDANIGGNLSVAGTTNLNGPTSVNNTFQTNGNTIIGNDPSDSLIVNASTEFNGPVTFNDQVDFVNGLKTYPLIIENGTRQSVVQFDAANNLTFTSNAGVAGYLFDRNVSLTAGRSFTATGTSATGNPEFTALNAAGLVMTDSGNTNNLQLYINDSNLSGQLTLTRPQMNFRLTQPANATLDAVGTQDSGFYFNDKIVIKEGASIFGTGSPQALTIQAANGNKVSLSSNAFLMTGNSTDGTTVGISPSIRRAVDGSSAQMSIDEASLGNIIGISNNGFAFFPQGSIPRPRLVAALIPSTFSQTIGGITTGVGQPFFTLRTDDFSGAPAGTTGVRAELNPQSVAVFATNGTQKSINTEINLAGFETSNTVTNRRTTIQPGEFVINDSAGNSGAGGVAFLQGTSNSLILSSSNNAVSGRETITLNAASNTNTTLSVANAARRTTISKGGLRLDTLLTGDNVQFFLDQNTQNPSFTTTGTRYNFDRPIFTDGTRVLTTNDLGNITAGDGTGGAAPDSVTLGADTTGNYIATIAQGPGILVSGSGVESANATIGLANSGVTAGTYGSSTEIPVLTVDAFGRITSASTQTAAPSASTLNVTDSANLPNQTFRVPLYDSARPNRLFTSPGLNVSFSGDGNAALLSAFNMTSSVVNSGTVVVGSQLRTPNLLVRVDGLSMVVGDTFAGRFNLIEGTATNGFIFVRNNTQPLATLSNSGFQLSAGAFSGSGASLTALNASNIASGTLAVARLPTSGVTAGTFGSATQSAQITVDAFGRITAASNVAIANGASGLGVTQENAVNATRYLTFTDQLSGTESAALIDTGLTYNPSTNVLTAGSFSGAFSGSGAALTALNASNITTGTLAAARLPTSGVTAGTYGSGSQVPVLTVDAFGRITSATNQAITVAGGSGLTITQENTTAATRYLTFTDQLTGAESAGLIDTGLTYNPGTNVLTAGSFAGSFTGSGAALTALNASNITTGTLAAARLPTSGVTAGTYGSGSQVPVLTVDAFGRITNATTQAVVGGGSSAAVVSNAATAQFITFTNTTTGTARQTNSNFVYVPSTGVVQTGNGGFIAGTGTNSTQVLNNGVIVQAGTARTDLTSNGLVFGGVAGRSLTANDTVFNLAHNNAAGTFNFSLGGAAIAQINSTNFTYSGRGNFGNGLAVGNLPTQATAASQDFVILSNAAGSFGRVNVADFLAQASGGSSLTITQENATNATRYLTFTDQLSGNETAGLIDTGLTYNPGTNLLTAGAFSGSGAALTALNASNITTGTLAAARLPTSGVTAGSYGSDTTAARFTVDGFGRITAASNNPYTVAAGSTINGSAVRYSGNVGTDGTFYSGGPALSGISGFTDLKYRGRFSATTLSSAAGLTIGMATTGILNFGGAATAPNMRGDTANLVADLETDASFFIRTKNQAFSRRSAFQSDANLVEYFGGFNQTTWATAAGASRMNLNLTSGNLLISGTLSQNSDIRLKQNINRLDSRTTLEKLKLLSGYSYQFKENPSETQYGLIAQEVQRQFPEMVSTTQAGTLAVSYTMMVPTLLEGVKEVDSRISAINLKVNEYDAKFNEVNDSISLVNTKLTEITDQLLAQTTGLDALSEEVTGIKAQTADLTERIVKLEGRETLADLFTKNEETQMVQVNFNGLQAKNLKAERIEANKAYFVELEAERAKIAELEAQKIKAGQIGTDEKVLVANFGVANDVFTALPGATYMVTAMGEDGSFATVSVLNNNGVLIVNKMAGEGIDVMANGQNFSISGIGQKVKVSWLRTS